MKRYLVHTIPNSRANEVKILSENIIKMKVTASPIDGKANEEVVKLLSKHFKVHKGQVLITKGISSDKKIVEIS